MKCLWTSVAPIGMLWEHRQGQRPHREHHPGEGTLEGKDRVKGFFGSHTPDYTAASGYGAGRDLELLVSLLAPGGTELVLDVATAAGNTAIALAAHVSRIIGIDLTVEMGRQFAAQARLANANNLRFVLGDVDALPFKDQTFDIVTCRRAAHHFPEVSTSVAEMARVLRPGGRLAIVDQTVHDDPRAAALHNRLEHARDSSHVRALGPREWRDLLEQAGLQVQAAEVMAQTAEFRRWLSPVAPDGPEAADVQAIIRSSPADVASHILLDGPNGPRYLKQLITMVARRLPE